MSFFSITCTNKDLVSTIDTVYTTGTPTRYQMTSSQAYGL